MENVFAFILTFFHWKQAFYGQMIIGKSCLSSKVIHEDGNKYSVLWKGSLKCFSVFDAAFIKKA